MKMKLVKLTESEIGHIQNLLWEAQERGDYYGNKEQYWARNARIARKLEDE